MGVEMGQMVCGSCHHLLSYPQPAQRIQCSCCQTVNLVLEAHQVGQVKCGSCSVLLMYPYGAPSVRCSSCNFVTEIGKMVMSLIWCLKMHIYFGCKFLYGNRIYGPRSPYNCDPLCLITLCASYDMFHCWTTWDWTCDPNHYGAIAARLDTGASVICWSGVLSSVSLYGTGDGFHKISRFKSKSSYLVLVLYNHQYLVLYSVFKRIQYCK